MWTKKGGHSYCTVELDSQDGVGIRVVANFCALLEVAHLQLAWRGQAYHCH